MRDFFVLRKGKEDPKPGPPMLFLGRTNLLERKKRVPPAGHGAPRSARCDDAFRVAVRVS